MIPKKIHYCWFGQNEKPETVQKMLNTWRQKLPEYEIIEWNEENFDVSSNIYTEQAYEAKKYAFVTDYVRLYAVYNYGGIYMDTDVEVIKELDDFLIHDAFTGCENERNCVTGLMGGIAGHRWYEDLLSNYQDRSFYKHDGSFDLTTNTKTITEITTNIYGWRPIDELQTLNQGLVIYPSDYFCAKSWDSGVIFKTENTYTIHHFAGSWKSSKEKMISKTLSKVKKIMIAVIGEENFNKLRGRDNK